jgi:hypothetical protein
VHATASVLQHRPFNTANNFEVCNGTVGYSAVRCSACECTAVHTMHDKTVQRITAERSRAQAAHQPRPWTWDLGVGKRVIVNLVRSAASSRARPRLASKARSWTNVCQAPHLLMSAAGVRRLLQSGWCPCRERGTTYRCEAAGT